MTDVLPLVAGAWGVLMGLAPLLQIRTILQRRSSADVSVGSMAVLLVGFALWLAYGISIGDGALIVTNVTALAVTTTAVGVTLAFRRPRSPATTAPAPAPG
jgi:uncharacterized protein with PQ loop repeat